MRLAFILYKYFPFGGLQRDFLRIAQCCQAKGFQIVVYTMSWESDIPSGFDVNIHRSAALSACGRNKKFYRWVQRSLQQLPADLVIGFNKMPGLDVYYAADTCYAHKAQTLRGYFYRHGRRCKHFSSYENAVFSVQSKTEILLISKVQQALFLKYYGTQPERMHLLPPGVAKDRKQTDNANELRSKFREKYAISSEEKLLILLGSGFITKGLDRTLIAMSSLPQLLRGRVKLFVVGKDNPGSFKAQARHLGIDKQVTFFSGLNDVPSLLQGGDALIHPAYNENTGTVLLEALVAGLPVLCTDVCGYAHYIEKADAGLVTPSPFDQSTLNRQLIEILTSEKTRQWKYNAIAFSNVEDLYSMPDKAASIIEMLCQRHAVLQEWNV